MSKSLRKLYVRKNLAVMNAVKEWILKRCFFFFNLQKNENGEVFSGQLFLCIAGALKDRYVCWEDVLCGY